jgi:hypothetical protein
LCLASPDLSDPSQSTSTLQLLISSSSSTVTQWVRRSARLVSALTFLTSPITPTFITSKYCHVIRTRTRTRTPTLHTVTHTTHPTHCALSLQDCADCPASIAIGFLNIAWLISFPASLQRYLENAYNNYLINLSMPHGYQQRVWRWHDAGLGGGEKTATNGRSVWSTNTLNSLKQVHIYRGDLGNENVAAWGDCNLSSFYAFPGLLCLPVGVTVLDMEVVPGAGGGNATVLWVLSSGNDTSLTAYDGCVAIACPYVSNLPTNNIAPSARASL